MLSQTYWVAPSRGKIPGFFVTNNSQENNMGTVRAMKSTSKKHKEPEINYDQLQGNKLVQPLQFNGKIILNF